MAKKSAKNHPLMKGSLLSGYMLVMALSISNLLRAQDICDSGFMPFKKGASFELTSYDKKQKEVSKSSQKIIDIEKLSNGIKATAEVKTSDNKGKILQTGTYGIECKDNAVYVDMRSLFDPRSMAGFENMEMEISGEALEIPSKLAVGQTLPDGNMTIKLGTGGTFFLTMNFAITGRKVDANEKVTTPAGTFDCYKITQETEIKSMMKRKFKSSTWYAKGVGTVKTENYDSKGDIESYTLLTRFEG